MPKVLYVAYYRSYGLKKKNKKKHRLSVVICLCSTCMHLLTRLPSSSELAGPRYTPVSLICEFYVFAIVVVPG